MSNGGPTSFDPLAVADGTLDTPLARQLAQRIAQDGPITFRDWMDACLYDPQHGYYRRGQPTVGTDGDFLTSPEVHPIFGAAVGHLAAALWRALDQPAPLRIAEVGPGTGALAEALLRHLHAAEPQLADTQYTLVEPDADAAQKQRDRLASIHPDDAVHRVDDIAQLPDGQHLIFANELLDAIPVQRLVNRLGLWRVLRVDHSREQGFHAVEGEVAERRLNEPLDNVAPDAQQIVEVSPERADVVAALACALDQRGLLLLFDYGYPRARLYSQRYRDGTLTTFHRHTPGDDPYARPGQQDMTCHIDLDQVREAGEAAGLTPLPELSQAEWLHHIGADILPAVADADDTARYLAARRAVEMLTDPAGLGRIAVIGLQRGGIGSLPGWDAS